MAWLRVLLSRVGGLFSRNPDVRELDEELRAHLEMLTDENLRRGMNPIEARRAARLSFGGVDQTMERYRDQRGLPVIETVIQDIRYSLRMIRKNLGFSVASVFTLGLGIGASASIFSVVNAVLLQPFPYRSADRLAVLWEKTGREDLPVSYLNFLDWQQQNHVFEKMAAFRFDNFNLTDAGDPERIVGAVVTPGFLSTLGVTPALGRDFLSEEERPGGEAAAILVHGFWQRRFGGDTGLIGKQIDLNKQRFTVVGVTSPQFTFGGGEDVIVPLSMMANRFTVRGKDPGLTAIARLKDGVEFDRARSEMETIMSGLVAQYPGALAGKRIGMQPFYQYTVGNVQTTLFLLMIAVGFVLLIACTNVAGLLLARASSRRKEIAIRASIGASRWRLVQQFLTESVILALAGGVLGLIVAFIASSLFVTMSPPGLPRAAEIHVDSSVLLFTLSISILSGVLYGIFPALQASRPNLNEALKEGGRESAAGKSVARRVLVVAEVALSFVLLIGGGLMVRTIRNLQRVDPGFDPSGLLTMQIAISADKDAGPRVASFLRELRSRVLRLPGVQGVAFSNGLPYTGANQLPVNVVGEPLDGARQSPVAVMYIAGADYFQTMKLRVLKGRSFSVEDAGDRPRVAVIDEVMAEKYFPGQDPIGRRINLPVPSPQAQPDMEIVGIVGHVKNYGLDGRSPVQPQFYLDLDQVSEQMLPVIVRRLNLVVRASADPLSLAGPIRKEVSSLDKDQPVFGARTMEGLISDTIASQSYSALLLSVFALIALVLASVGIYGVMSYSVRQRRHEIGIRLALGARASDVLKLVIGQGMALVFSGIVIGLVAAFALTRLLSALLFGVTAGDAGTFASVSILLTMVALLACSIPARRAARVDPAIALRAE